jgi:hypothetical protein
VVSLSILIHLLYQQIHDNMSIHIYKMNLVDGETY